MKEALRTHADSKDLLFLISSSGQSKNILNCADQAKKMGLKIILFTSFSVRSNPLRKKEFKF